MTGNEFLYHYTSFSAFLGMIDKQVFWATHIRYLNDISEQMLMWELIGQRIDALLSESPEQDRERLERLRSIAMAPPDCDTYVVCFSKDGGDRLSQWRGYCPSGGVSVGFREDALRNWCLHNIGVREEPLSTFTATLVDVWYVGVGDRAGRFANQYLKDTLTKNESMWPNLVSSAAARLKHPAFYEESEWRILHQDSSPTLHYRFRNSMMVPYVELRLGDLSKLLGKVIVGASPHVEETTKTIRNLMHQRGITGVEVESTGVPYRHW